MKKNHSMCEAMQEEPKWSDGKEWSEKEVEQAIERQRQRFLAYEASGLSMTKWILEREKEGE